MAILTGDWHMSDRPPRARAESRAGWYEVQADYLKQLLALARRVGGVPILHSGDVFDTADSPSELVNFLIDRMPHVYAVPGNHDLIHHSLADVRKTSYWTLVQAGKVTDLYTTGGLATPDVNVSGFPHGVTKDTRLHKRWDGVVNIAVAHRYAWVEGKGHPNAPEDGRADRVLDDYPWADVIHTGDNHAGFYHHHEKDRSKLINTGTFIRRHVNETHLHPFIELVLANGGVASFFINTSKDRFREVEKNVKEVGLDAADLIRELNATADAGVNFEEAVRHWLAVNKVIEVVADQVLKSLEDAKRDKS